MKEIKQLLIGFILFLVSILLFVPLAIWGIVELLISLFWKKHFFNGLSQFGEFFKLIATIIDVTGNVILAIPLNRILNTEYGYKFGSRFDTISFVLGHGLVYGTLSDTGFLVCKLLDIFEKDHCLKTYNNKLKINE